MLKNKKFMYPLMLLFLAFVITACGGGDDGGNNDNNGGDTNNGGNTEEQAGDNGGDNGGETAAGDVENGKKVFENNCLSCHGAEGAGGSGPNLQKSDVTEDREATLKKIKNGGGGMPAFGDMLSEQEIQDVTEYLVKKIAPKG